MLSSALTTLIFLPSSPPLALMSLIASCRPCSPVWPRLAIAPLSEVDSPTVTVSPPLPALLELPAAPHAVTDVASAAAQVSVRIFFGVFMVLPLSSDVPFCVGFLLELGDPDPWKVRGPRGRAVLGRGERSLQPH